MQEPVILLENVEVGHDEEPLLKGVDLRIMPGEFVYLIGKSGVGKTTLLRCLYADHPLSGGTARVCGIDLAGLRRRQVPQLRRRMGIVFQNFRLLDDRSVYANLDFVLRATGWKKAAERKEQIEKTLASVGVAHKAQALPSRLSEGEQQRVGIARALINNPQLILADEPTGNLDPVTSAEIMQLLVDVGRKTDTTMLISTHDFMMIDRFPSRVVMCEEGTLRDTEAQ
ncbi:MAG: ATP-binding cassette domain-containing protein [Bacteroidales bacterium]|nr:ATP-binding cassette domain-containing protein [Bacteroidales bacterium]